MHDDAAREIVERRAEEPLEEALESETTVPRNALEEWVHQRDQRERRGDLRIEACTLGDAARHDRRDCRGERQQKEEFHQRIAAHAGERFGAGEEINAVRDRIADEEVGDRRQSEIGQDLDQRVDLVLLAHGAELEEREARVHRQHHDCAKQNEQRIGTGPERFHRFPISLRLAPANPTAVAATAETRSSIRRCRRSRRSLY